MTDIDLILKQARLTMEQLGRLVAEIETRQQSLSNMVFLRRFAPAWFPQIKSTVAEFYDIHVKVLCSRTRTETVAKARHVAVFFMRELTDASLSEIGRQFNGESGKGLDHGSALNGINRVKERMSIDPKFAAEIVILRNRLTECFEKAKAA